MKLWLLQPRIDLQDGNNPWSPWYSKAFGFVVRAVTENDAREMANRRHGEENEELLRYHDTWLDSDYSTCSELLPEGDPGIIIRDFAGA